MKKILILLAFVPAILSAQTYNNVFCADHLWKDIQIGATAGSTGIGLDLKTTVISNLGLRVGFNYMPKLTRTTGFSMTSVQGTGDADTEERTKRLAGYLADLVGSEKVDNIVDMQIGISFVNAKILFDWTPFHQKNWRITAGIYAGTTRFAKACNTIEEGATTTAMRLYNNMYEQIQNLGEYEYPTISIGGISLEMDPITGEDVKERFMYYGRVAVQIGELADGTPVCLQPDEDAVLKADGKVNKVKPYLGFGYDTDLDKEKRWQLGIDAGFMYWGTPHLHTKYIVEKQIEDEYGIQNTTIDMQDICLVHDVKNIRGVIGNYTKAAKHLPLYPVLELRLGYRLFK